MQATLLILFYTLWRTVTVVTIEQRPMIRYPQFIEPSTNIEYIHLADHNEYRLYKLTLRHGSTRSQIYTVNKWLEEYLQASFETPNRFYPNVVEVCGTTMLAFFIQNTTVSTKNINALLLARLEAYDNSKYICYISVLKEHRQTGLGTKLLNEFIKDAIRLNNARVSLHVNTENKSALSLYLKCGMRCIDYIPGYYFGDQSYATQNAFSMVLEVKNVRNSTVVCQSAAAVEISPNEQAIYEQKCPQAFNG